MLSLFPQLLDWGWYVPFLFRIFLGLYFFFVGYGFIKLGSKKKDDDGLSWVIFGSLIIILGISFLLGIYVQIAGVLGFSLSLIAIYFKNSKSAVSPEPVKFYLLVGIVSLSLLFLGAGPHAFDLPL